MTSPHEIEHGPRESGQGMKARPEDLSPPRVGIVCPCFNESEAIPRFYRVLSDVLHTIEHFTFHIIFVDDGSTDDTLATLNSIAERDKRVSVYSLSRNFGHQAALSAGLDACEEAAVILMDSDLQHPPSLIPQMLNEWTSGADIVSMVRTETEGATLFKSLSASSFYSLFNFLSDTRIEPGAADFCLLSRQVYTTLREMPERDRFYRGLISWVGFDRHYLSYAASERVHGLSKYTLAKMVRLSLDAVFSFSIRPIRLAMQVGGLLTMTGLIYLIYVIGRWVILEDLVRGWASLMAVMMILGGVQLLTIALIGEYIARTNEQVKGRPLYILKQRPDSHAAQHQPSDET